VLPEIVDAVGKRATVFFDSGIRRGSDVVKAIALGADAVMVGRSTLYGVAAGGFDGAARALEIYHEEIRRVMALLGCNSLDELGPQYLKIDPTLTQVPSGRPALRVVRDAAEA
jgi:isopentenyl diphosphate isomerase/L-lactate dehydrogenase-like FMN-dependent dehydrogenase